jgi:hypothetical protein
MMLPPCVTGSVSRRLPPRRCCCPRPRGDGAPKGLARCAVEAADGDGHGDVDGSFCSAHPRRVPERGGTGLWLTTGRRCCAALLLPVGSLGSSPLSPSSSAAVVRAPSSASLAFVPYFPNPSLPCWRFPPEPLHLLNTAPINYRLYTPACALRSRPPSQPNRGCRKSTLAKTTSTSRQGLGLGPTDLVVRGRPSPGVCGRYARGARRRGPDASTRPDGENARVRVVRPRAISAHTSIRGVRYPAGGRGGGYDRITSNRPIALYKITL